MYEPKFLTGPAQHSPTPAFLKATKRWKNQPARLSGPVTNLVEIDAKFGHHEGLLYDFEIHYNFYSTQNKFK